VSFKEIIENALGKTTVRAVLAIGFSVVTWAALFKGLVSSELFGDLEKLIVIFFFTSEIVAEKSKTP